MKVITIKNRLNNEGPFFLKKMDTQYRIWEWIPSVAPKQWSLHTHTHTHTVVTDMYGLESLVWLPIFCEGAAKHSCLSMVWIFWKGCVQRHQSTTGCGNTTEAERLSCDYLTVYPLKHVVNCWSSEKDFPYIWRLVLMRKYIVGRIKTWKEHLSLLSTTMGSNTNKWEFSDFYRHAVVEFHKVLFPSIFAIHVI